MSKILFYGVTGRDGIHPRNAVVIDNTGSVHIGFDDNDVQKLRQELDEGDDNIALEYFPTSNKTEITTGDYLSNVFNDDGVSGYEPVVIHKKEFAELVRVLHNVLTEEG